MTLAIDVEGLSKSFGSHLAVDNVSLKIERGHICGFLGPNGSGKTTSLRMLCGLLTPDSGSGEVLGLEFPRGQLSGGWKQRLALAAAVMHNPKLLLLDEPTAGVDPQARRDFWDRIHGLADEGMTVLVSTHYMDEAERCHEIAYIFNGRLIARGTGDQVIAESGLVTFEVEGPRADRLTREFSSKPGVEMAAPFGEALHVSGTDRAALEAAIKPYRRDPYRWTEVQPTLEDVFINLMRVHAAPEVKAA
jgi:ABC-2 type transport system ATP-binding protein